MMNHGHEVPILDVTPQQQQQQTPHCSFLLRET